MAHSNKHIREAIKYAEGNGWTFTKSGPRAHAYGVLRCDVGHRECRISVVSTPRIPENHARKIRRQVNKCPGEEG